MFDKLLAAKVLGRSIGQINEVLGDQDWSVEDALYLLARKLKDEARPTMGRMAALRAEMLGNGHSLARHGPQMDDAALRLRLTTGTVGSTFAPADKGFATSFLSALTYNFTRIQALEKVSAALKATGTLLKPLIDTFEAQSLALVNQAKNEQYGKDLKAATKSRAALIDAVEALTVTRLSDSNDFVHLPLSLDRRVSSKPMQPGQLARDFVVFPERLGLVVHHDVVIGRGMRARADAPSREITNPLYTQGKKSKAWSDDAVEPMPPISGTMTMFNPPPQAFSAAVDPGSWPMPQHFPDNGTQGWRS